MTRSTKRRLAALLLPLPCLAVGALYLKLASPTRTIEVALTFPEFCVWYLGVKSLAVARAVALGYWYLLGAMICFAVLCGRDRVSKALFICTLATSALIGLVLVFLRGYNPG